MIEFTPELIASIVGIALSWLFGWFPGLRTWYAALKPAVKSGIMLSMLAGASTTIYLLAHYGVIQLTEPITLWRLVTVFFAASLLNQTAYTLTPEADDVREIKGTRSPC